MADYKKMYKDLFNSVTQAIDILKQAQIDAEETYINSSENDDNKVLQFKIFDGGETVKKQK